jgi:hypothetical protein
MASSAPIPNIFLNGSAISIPSGPSIPAIPKPTAEQTTKTSIKLPPKLLSPLDHFQDRYVKSMAKKIIKWIAMKEPTQQAWNKYRKDVFGFHNVKKDEKERIVELLNINQEQLPADQPSGNVKKRTLKGTSKFVDDAKKAVKEVAVDAKKKGISHLSKVFPDLDKGASEAQTSGGGASGAEVGTKAGTKTGAVSRAEAEPRRQPHPQSCGVSRPGETGRSSWVAPTDW